MPKKIEFDVYITPDGEEYDLSDWGKTFLLSESGQGMAPIEYRTTRGPFQHGETPIDFVLRPRILQYVMRLSRNSRIDYWQARNNAIDAFRPNRQFSGELLPGTLKKIWPDESERAIDVFLESGLDFASGQGFWDGWGSTNTIRFVAYDPVWYDPNQQEESFSLGALDNLIFPITFPIIFGTSLLSDSTTITYTGTWIEFPIIYIDGPINIPIITNLTTGEVLSLYYNIPSGRTVTIDLRYGKKTVVDDLGTNLVGALTTDSDLATFHLATEPEAANGQNIITVSGTAAQPGTTNIRIAYYTRYGGI